MSYTTEGEVLASSGALTTNFFAEDFMNRKRLFRGFLQLSKLTEIEI